MGFACSFRAGGPIWRWRRCRWRFSFFVCANTSSGLPMPARGCSFLFPWRSPPCCSSSCLTRWRCWRFGCWKFPRSSSSSLPSNTSPAATCSRSTSCHPACSKCFSSRLSRINSIFPSAFTWAKPTASSCSRACASRLVGSSLPTPRRAWPGGGGLSIIQRWEDEHGNTKHQTPNTRKTPSSKHQDGAWRAIWSLVFGVFLVFGVWCLIFPSMLKRYLTIYFALWRNSVSREMTFKGNFLLWIFVELLWFALQLSFIGVLYLHTDHIGSWTKWEVVMLIGASHFIQQIFQAFFLINCTNLSELVRTGKFGEV